MKSLIVVSNALRRLDLSSSLSSSSSSSSSSSPSSYCAKILRQLSSTAGADAVEKPPLKLTDMKLNVDISDDVYIAHSLSTANSKDVLKYKIHNHINDLKIHPTDTGTTAIQSTFCSCFVFHTHTYYTTCYHRHLSLMTNFTVAALTEKINNLVRHATQHKKDKHSYRGFQGLLSRRRKLMQYMKRKDIEGLQKVAVKLGIQREALNLR